MEKELTQFRPQDSGENMFVNKKVLADCNIEVPGPDYTWDQFAYELSDNQR